MPEIIQKLIVDIAKASDICVKPWIHSVTLKSLEDEKSSNSLNDFIFIIKRRDADGIRYKKEDFEIEIYSSGKDISMMFTWTTKPNQPILWHGKTCIWMDSDSGVICKAPDNAFQFESLARRIRVTILSVLNY